jgi:hypothetical protein
MPEWNARMADLELFEQRRLCTIDEPKASQNQTFVSSR